MKTDKEIYDDIQRTIAVAGLVWFDRDDIMSNQTISNLTAARGYIDALLERLEYGDTLYQGKLEL